MKHMMSLIAMLLLCVFAFGACAESALVPGTYEVSADGFGGKIVMDVTVDANGVTGIEVKEQAETPEFGGAALPVLTEEALSSGAFAVDAYAGATFTSNAFNAALADAEKLAKGEAVEVSTETTLADGTYSATVPSLIDIEGLVNVGEMTLEATFKDNKIESISVPKYTDTQVIGGIAFEELAEKVVENQSTAVDALSGATVSSRAFLSALDLCIEQAGGDPAAFKARTLPEHVAETLSYETDVVIIGAGMAGLTAAIEAVDQGANVIICEAQDVFSNSTSRSVGEVMGAATKAQKAAGIEDTVEAFYDDIYSLYKDEPALDPVILRKMVYDSTSLNDFLLDNGWEVGELVNVSNKGVRATKRGHISKGAGSGLTNALVNSAREKGVNILLGTTVDSLIQDENGVYVGVHATTKGGDDVTVTGKAVIVATGSYSANPEMLAELNPKMDNIEILVGSGDGSGYKMLENAGADMIQIDYIAMMYYFYGAGWTEFPELIPESPTIPNCEVLSVDGAGRRIVSEDDFTFEYTKINYEEGYHEGYCIYGQATADKYPIMTRLGLTTQTHNGDPFGYKEDSIEALAADVGFDPEVLKATVDRYNELCAKGVDEDFGKEPQYLVPIEGPYYLLRMPMICTDGYNGARINENAQVIDTNGQPIPGLYAAGAVACAQVTNINYFGCGTMLLNCGVYGRAAADHIVSTMEK